jgi:hypothetical protein
MANEIATTILSQLGGSKFKAMTGAKNFVALERGLQFDFPKAGKNKANRVQIVLSPTDLYTVAFYKARGLNCDLLASSHGLFADMLKGTIERATGFALSL